MTKYLFNRTPLVMGGTIEQPEQALVKNTPGLWNASPEDALMYGGDLTREALSAMRLRNDRRYVTVDVKVHQLMKGMCPAIPGWHTDGVPRWADGSPAAGHGPRLSIQAEADARGLRPPRYHLLVTGEHCLTEFVNGQFYINFPLRWEDTDGLYKFVSDEVESRLATGELKKLTVPSCTVVEWDWWAVHQGTVSTGAEWRYLIRVTESDTLAPQADLRSVLRTQQNVYVPGAYGW